jgi:hypothetical protein
MLAAAILIVSVTPLSPLGAVNHVDAWSPNCSGGNTKYTYGPNGAYGWLSYYYTANPYPDCGWIGYVAETENSDYNSVSQIEVNNFQTWVCGSKTSYNQSDWNYNTNYIGVSSPIWNYDTCGPQAEFWPEEEDYGQWGWSSYLNGW